MQIDVSQAVSDAIKHDVALDTEAPQSHSSDVPLSSVSPFGETHSQDALPVVSKGRSNRAMGSLLALAASMAFAIFLVIQPGESVDSIDPSNSIANSHASTDGLRKVSVVIPETSESAVEPKIMIEMSPEHARYFNQYLLRHAEHSVRGTPSGLMPLVRVASVNSVGV